MSTTSIRRPPEPGFGSSSSPLLSERYSPQVLPPLLGTIDLTSLFLLNVYWVTNVTPLVAGGTASFTPWLIGGLLFFLPFLLVLAQLGTFFSHVRSIYHLTPYTLWPTQD